MNIRRCLPGCLYIAVWLPLLGCDVMWGIWHALLLSGLNGAVANIICTLCVCILLMHVAYLRHVWNLFRQDPLAIFS